MTLTYRTDFALRVLMYLAALEAPGRRVTSAEIAEVFEVSLNHLVKVVNELARHGYVKTSRGLGGGIALLRAPGEIGLGQLVEDFQGPLRLHDCVGRDGMCVIDSFCKLRGIFAEADAMQRRFLDEYTLADVIPSPVKLEALARPRS